MVQLIKGPTIVTDVQGPLRDSYFQHCISNPSTYLASVPGVYVLGPLLFYISIYSGLAVTFVTLVTLILF